ncbi:diguanylate cyclase [Fonticella tunisiensis]|uniref:Stage 0 sporulation protein A homolog n=1 Tax=Fonticella tunisiensis TaxID=1096341 RepID=A0A4R7KP71_9CLOT|nr:diguanylate cyclase [Fonticella tunisiensis]TDT60901.1 response regulator receiver modulated diguanylate cyclase [Fonticella tunisiensis]
MERILVVEDSKFQAFITKDILTKNGYSVTCVESAEDAMKTNMYEQYDIVLLDVVLPGISGYEFCEIIKKNNSLIPVIILTSMDDEKSVIKALNSGADDYLKKPYNVDELLARIKVQLRTRRLQLELTNKNEELQKAYNTIKKLAITDVLTGAYNRSYIKDYMAKLLDESPDDNFYIGCAMIDIDNFKKINDTFGHLTGDIVLKNLSNICRNNVKDRGAVIRFGGEEFLVLINNPEYEEVADMMENIRKQSEENMCCGFQFTISAGVCIFQIRRDNALVDLQEAIKIADKMLYISKNSGKNKVSIEKLYTA